MCLYKYAVRILFFILLLLEPSNKFVNGFSIYENGDLYKIKPDSTKTKLFDLVRSKHVLRLSTTSATRYHTFVNSSETKLSNKKWQVGRVSQKQYEIINILWRKPKVFVGLSTVIYSSKQPLSLLPLSKLTTTPSFIEFYYTDDMVEDFCSKTRKYPLPKEEKLRLLRNNEKLKSVTRDIPIVTFLINNPNYVPLAEPVKHLGLNGNVKRNSNALTSIQSGLQIQYPLPKNTLQSLLQRPQENYFTAKTITFTKHQDFVDNETCVNTTQRELRDTVINNISNISIKSVPRLATSIEIVPTIAYDRVKFFELYDKNTPLIYKEQTKFNNLNDIDHERNENIINITIFNHHHDAVHQDDKRIKAKHSKKHITESNKYNSRNMKNTSTSFKAPRTITTHKKINVTNVYQSIISKVAKWSDNSFMAAYIYEPAQVHCDAAGISLHWLVTSGSCLSKRHKNPSSDSRSAFVVYCSSYWWAADRIAYVKYSVIHPGFHQHDTKRRHMYNIGLIQVVIPMNTCPGWAPISLMSHQFITDVNGTRAQAIGWGLDRYDTRYSSVDLPKFPLMKFESQVYSDSCPGNYGYRRAKHLYGKVGVKNVYCMWLPPYTGEATDPIHGSMLVVAGKLCALYLQEERRASGEQSARYTGAWRLVPWVTSVAHEPADAETFKIAI